MGGKNNEPAEVPIEFRALANTTSQGAAQAINRSPLNDQSQLLLAQGREGIADAFTDAPSQIGAAEEIFADLAASDGAAGIPAFTQPPGLDVQDALGAFTPDFTKHLNELLTPATDINLERGSAAIKEAGAASGTARGTFVPQQTGRLAGELFGAQSQAVGQAVGTAIPDIFRTLGADLSSQRAASVQDLASQRESAIAGDATRLGAASELAGLPQRLVSLFSGPTQFEAGLPIAQLGAALGGAGGIPVTSPIVDTSKSDATAAAAMIASAAIIACHTSAVVFHDDPVRFVLFRYWILTAAPAWVRRVYLSISYPLAEIARNVDVVRRTLRFLLTRFVDKYAH